MELKIGAHGQRGSLFETKRMSDLLPHGEMHVRQEGTFLGIQKQKTSSIAVNPLFRLDTALVAKNANILRTPQIQEENESSESSPTEIMASARSNATKRKKRRRSTRHLVEEEKIPVVGQNDGTQDHMFLLYQISSQRCICSNLRAFLVLITLLHEVLGLSCTLR